MLNKYRVSTRDMPCSEDEYVSRYFFRRDDVAFVDVSFDAWCTFKHNPYHQLVEYMRRILKRTSEEIKSEICVLLAQQRREREAARRERAQDIERFLSRDAESAPAAVMDWYARLRPLDWSLDRAGVTVSDGDLECRVSTVWRDAGGALHVVSWEKDLPLNVHTTFAGEPPFQAMKDTPLSHAMVRAALGAWLLKKEGADVQTVRLLCLYDTHAAVTDVDCAGAIQAVSSIVLAS